MDRHRSLASKTTDDILVVRYSSWRALWANVGAFFMLGLLAWHGILVLLWPITTILALVVLYTLADAALALDRTPMLVVDSTGITLPAFGGEAIGYDALDSFWFTRRHTSRPLSSWWTVSFQCSPRRTIAGTWRTALRVIRTNTLIDGDVMFDCRYLNQSEVTIAAALKRHHPGGWLSGARPIDELSQLLPSG